MATKKVAELQGVMKLDTKQFSAALTRMKTSMSSLSKHVTDRNRVIRSSFNSVAKSAQDAAAKISAAQRGTAAGYREVSNNIAAMKKATEKAIQPAVKDLKQLESAARKASEAMRKIQTSNPTKAIKGTPNAAATANLGSSFRTAAAESDAMTSKVLANNSKISNSFRNVKNIAQGIVLAQTFYSGLNAIQGVVGGMWDMAKAVETTNASFTTLLGNAEQAKALSNYVQDYANESAFTFETATDAAKKLLAYGFKVESLGTVLETIGDAAAALGSSEAFGSIARALGQIQTKGKLATQEVLQLTEAGIPAYEILQEKLGLTREELGELGKAGIDANTALNALLAGIQERFGGAMNAMANTVEGLQSNIKDSLSYIGSEAMQPLFQSWRGMLQGMAAELSTWVQVIRSTGLGGLFEHIVPPEMHNTLRQFVANLDQLRMSLMNLGSAIMPLVNAFLALGVQIGNVVLPVINMMVGGLSWLTSALAQNTMFVRIATSAALGLLTYITVAKAVTLATKAFTGITAAIGPILSVGKSFISLARSAGIAAAVIQTVKGLLSGGLGFAKAAAAVAGVGAAVAGVSGMFKGLSDNLGKMTGANGNAYLQPEMYEEAALGAGDFNKALSKTNEGLDAAGDKTDKLGKKAKEAGKKATEALMAFDEVFTIKEPDETKTPDTGGAGGGVGDFDVPSFGGGGMAPLPSMPDFGAFAEEYTKNFDEAMKNKFKPETRYFRDLWDNIKIGISAGFESIGGALQLASNVFYIPYKIIQGVVKSIMTLFDGNKTTLGQIWSETWADIQVYTINGLSNLKAETSRGMGLVRKSTQNDLKAVTETFETAMKELPQVTKDNVGEAASTFTRLLRALDEDSLLILRGTSETMRLLFNNIRADMSEDEAMKQFEKNLKMMANAGKLETGAMAADIEKAMKKIKDGTVTETTKMTRETEDLWNLMSHNANASSAEMADLVLGNVQNMDATTIDVLKGLGGTWDQIFKGITSDSDLNSDEARKLVESNIATMRANGVFDLNSMKTEAADAFLKMAKDADARTQEMKKFVNTGTFDASVLAGANARQLHENVMQVLDDLPWDSKEEMEKAKNNMVDELQKAGYLTENEAEQMKHGITGELEKTNGEVKTIFGVDLRAVIKGVSPTLQEVASSTGRALGQAMLDGVWNKLSNTVFSWNWWWEKVKNGVAGALEAMNPLSRALDRLQEKQNTVNSWTYTPHQYDSPIGPQPARARLASAPMMMSVGAVRGLGAARTRSTAGANSAELIGAQVARAMAGGLQMQTAVLANQVSQMNTGAGRGNNQVVINAWAMDDSNVRVLLRRLRLEAEREKGRTFGTQPSTL